MSNETMTVSRLIPEEDVIDGLFDKCDNEKTGRVTVSSLINYLQSTAGQDKQSLTAIKNLSVMLDPKGTNSAIDLVTYRKGIKQWIRDVRQNNSVTSVSEEPMQRNILKRQNKSLYSQDNLHSPVPGKLDHLRQSQDLNMSNATVENSLLDISVRHFESEISELTTRVGDLQYQNRKLAEENTKLEQQLEAQEESMNTMNQETTTLKKKIKSLQELADLRTEIQQENEELKVSLTKYHERRKELEYRLNQQERETTALQGQIADYESKVQILTSELENASIQQKSLQSTLVEQKQLLRKLTDERTMHEVQLSEKNSQVKDLQNCVDELNKMNEELKHDHDDLQIQLVQTQQEINNFQMKDDRPNMSNSSGCVDDLEEDVDGTVGGHGSSNQSTAYSTPVKRHSIHTEIKETLGESFHLPSPLSDKELDESFLARSNSSGGESWCTEELIDYEVNSLTKPSGEGVKTLNATKLIEKFQKQQEAFTNQVNEVINAVGVNPDRGNYSRRLFVNSDGDDDDDDDNTETLREQERHENNSHTEIRLKKLTLVLQKLKGENEHLLRIHDEAVESLANWEKNVDSSVDNRLTVLRDVLLEERALKKQYLAEVQSLKRALGESKQNLKEKEVSTQELQQELSDLEDQLNQLRKTNLDLAEKCHKSELKLSDLQEDVLQSTYNLEKEKYRSNDLEETLTSTKLARQLDLRDIWRLVQKDVENECMEEQNDSPESSSTDLLKEQISKEIECLKDSLVKRQVALGALKGKPMKLTLDSSGNYCPHMDISPSSPLVDALTIDFFNGNYPMARTGNRRAGTLSSLNQYSSLDRESCPACQKNINASTHHTLSCPSLHPRHCHPDPGVVDHHGNYSFTNLNTSSSSSTSGIDVSSPRCSRSVDGQNRRKDFIRSSIKYGSGSQTSAESNANSDSSHHRQHKYSRNISDRMHKKENLCVNVESPSGFRRPSFTNAIENRKDANENNVSHFTRSRSSSFQAAIERGRKSPVDEVDFISSSTDSTPDRTEYPQCVKQDMYASSKSDGKSVSFHLSTEEYFDTSSEVLTPETDPRSQDRPDTSHSAAHDVSFSSQLNRQSTVPPARKLSTLIEEDTDHSESHSEKTTVTPQLIKSIVEEYATPNRISMTHLQDSNPAAFTEDQVRKNNEKNTMSKTGEFQEKKETSKKRPHGDTEESSAKSKEKTMDKPPGSTASSDHPKLTSKKISEKKVQVKAEEPLVVPGSPENGMVEEPRLSPKLSPKAKPESRMAKLRQNNLAKKREQMRTMKLPELREQTEGDVSVPQLLTVSEHTLTPPPPSQDTVTPSLPDEFLERLGLKPAADEEGVNADDLPENEIEKKFCSLALAFKTDRLTLDKRKGIQEKSRNLAEVNVEMELTGIKDAAEELNHSVTDAKLREVIHRIQGHIDVLEQSAVKVSATAEVFGAVQQEKRMSVAMEIMISYVNHLKSAYDKDHSELEEAKKLLQDKPFGTQSFLDIDRSNRSMSVAALKDYPLFMEYKQQGGGRESVTEDEDPKQRFQALVGNTQMRNSVATTFRRGSLERQSSVQSSKSSSSVSLSRESSTEKSKDSQDKVPIKQGSQEEEAYHKGFEDGVKAKLGQELSELREKQNHIGQSLEDVMDKVEKSKEEDEREKEEAAERRMMQMRALGLQKPSWENAGRTFRLALAGLIFMMAVGMVIMTILPGSASGMDLHADKHHFGAPPT